MLLIYHKAILDAVGDSNFDAVFEGRGVNEFFHFPQRHPAFLKVQKFGSSDTLRPGWQYYYRNPDVSDRHPDFAGENAVFLGWENGAPLFFAHGMTGKRGPSIVTETELLSALRAARRRGATIEPFREEGAFTLDEAALKRMAGRADAGGRSGSRSRQNRL